jgi:hypothetical protein
LSPTEKALRNLIPAKPGEVRNPEGRNQFTYRREAERHLDEWCKFHGREMVRMIANEARAGKPWAAKLILDRVLPTVERHEHSIAESAGAGALLDRLAHIATRRRTNGSGERVEPSGANGGNGADS